jgi:hypothetical protein
MKENWSYEMDIHGAVKSITCKGWTVLHLNPGTIRNIRCYQEVLNILNSSGKIISVKFIKGEKKI